MADLIARGMAKKSAKAIEEILRSGAGGGVGIDDTSTTSTTQTWSASKIYSEIEEVRALAGTGGGEGGGVAIDDTLTDSTTTTWSSSKIDTEIGELREDTNAEISAVRATAESAAASAAAAAKINDTATTSATETWSATKIASELEGIRQSVQTAGGGATLVEVSHSMVVLGGATSRVSLDVDFNKYDIRTVEARSSSGEAIRISIFENAVNGKMIYQSLDDSEIYDILNIPCEDKDGTTFIHLGVANLGATNTTVTLTIKVTSLN